jgi:ATP/maltotriose-dependent transcriptional regulator MalT
MLANLARRQGEYELALSAFNALLAEMESAGDTRGAAEVVSDLANVHYLSADFTAGWTCLERSRAIAGDLRDPVLESGWRFLGGQLALHEGRYELARSLLAEELEMAGPQSGTLYSGYVLMNLGSVCREQGDYVEADRLLTQGLQVAERYGDNSLLPLSVAGMSALATALGQHERALCLAGAAAALRGVTGAATHSPAHRSMFERWLAASRAVLSDGAAAAAWQAGQEMSAKQAVAFAQASSAPTTSDTPATAGPEPTTVQGPLTRRETEVAALIAQGLSNRQIAERLVITSRTVASHIENILEKLAFTSRTQIAVWAMEHGLVAPSLS